MLGGDGSILTALRRYAGQNTPVFAVNFGELGFLATIEPDDVDDGFRRAFAGEFEVLALPALCLGARSNERQAMNDVSVHRRPGQRVAQLAYAVGDEEIGRVTCDGLVAATPAGSTGYNLANGGPVMAWGVHGFVVSFIAPHSLTARALVVAPDDTLVVTNQSREEPVMLATDGRPVDALGPGEALEVRFIATRATSRSCRGRRSTNGFATSSAAWPSGHPRRPRRSPRGSPCPARLHQLRPAPGTTIYGLTPGRSTAK